jgi:hypothetical protein
MTWSKEQASGFLFLFWEEAIPYLHFLEFFSGGIYWYIPGLLCLHKVLAPKFGCEVRTKLQCYDQWSGLGSSRPACLATVNELNCANAFKRLESKQSCTRPDCKDRSYNFLKGWMIYFTKYTELKLFKKK